MSAAKKNVQAPYSLPKLFPTPLEIKWYKVTNWIENKLWPVRPLAFFASAFFAGSIYYKYPNNILLNLLPETSTETSKIVKIGSVSIFTVYTFVLVIRQFLKKTYFSYKKFLFENPKKPSVTTKLWGILRKLLSFSPPILESCDSLLPNLPVPALKDTVDQYLESMKYILSNEEMDEIRVLAQDFLKNEGKSLQRYAWIYSMITDNYVTSFWEKYAYLYGRYPLLINSSVAHCDLIESRQTTRAHRAARITWIEVMSHLAIDRQEFKALGDGMVCTRHYKKMYAVCRVPGETVDHLELHGVQKHIVVLLRGKYYKIHICDENNVIYTVEQLTKIFNELLCRNSWEEGSIGKVAALTHDTRDSWAKNREKYFLSSSKNKEVLRTIESAIFFLTLDENDEFGYDENRPEVLSNFMKSVLTGNGCNRWVDKSLNYVCSKNSRAGGTTEHSIADGAEFDHIMENFITMETVILELKSIEEQEKMAEIQLNETLKLADELNFEVNDESLLAEIERCYETHQKLADDVDLYALAFRDFGKGKIKKFGVSPDGFIQMAIQLAIYKDQGSFVLTYEPASVRFYANSRTETLRTVNEHSCEFVLAMINNTESKEEKIGLLKRACETHVIKNKNCMTGKGIDRHLFVLYVLSKMTGTKSHFLEKYISQKWTLSTSHVPNVTNQNDEDTDPNLTWLGACFGAVAHNGYGVCYRFGGNHGIFANITSYKSAQNTDSTKFAKLLTSSLHEIAKLFD